MATQAAPARAALDSLATLQQLTLEAGLSEDRRQLVFRILNRSVSYCRHDRAVLWGIEGRRVKLLGVSGSVDVKPHSPQCSDWCAVIAALRDRDKSRIVDARALTGETESWDRLVQRAGGLSVVWLPIAVEGRVVAGLWLERWGGVRFAESDLKRLEPLALAYAVAWRSVAGTRGRLTRWLLNRRRVLLAIGLLFSAAALALVRLPLRIVAPCEVVPENPVAVTAPLNGVIDEVVVLPGRPVAAGELLAVYDRRVALEELKVAEQQVEIIASDLQRARMQAFESPVARSEIALLENRLAQEHTRLRIARHRAERLELRAPVAGTLMFGDPHEWRGRPVQVGERIMMIVDPRQTKLRIRLPESDNIAFDEERALTVVLDSDPRAARSARLRFLANHSETGADGIPYFRAEAEWSESQPDLKLGLQGSAVLYGEDVSLGYWLLRRPLAALRGFLGI